MTSPVGGIIKPLSQVDDPVFSTNTMGEGVAIIPYEDDIVSPVDGKITCLFKTKHAIGITTKQGVEILIHIGIDTVRLDGKYFDCFVKQDQIVNKGDALIHFDRCKIQEEGLKTDVMLIVTNSEHFEYVSVVAQDHIENKTPVLKVK